MQDAPALHLHQLSTLNRRLSESVDLHNREASEPSDANLSEWLDAKSSSLSSASSLSTEAAELAEKLKEKKRLAGGGKLATTVAIGKDDLTKGLSKFVKDWTECVSKGGGGAGAGRGDDDPPAGGMDGRSGDGSDGGNGGGGQGSASATTAADAVLEAHRELIIFAGGLAPSHAIGLAAAMPHERVPFFLWRILFDPAYQIRFRELRRKALPHAESTDLINLDSALRRYAAAWQHLPHRTATSTHIDHPDLCPYPSTHTHTTCYGRLRGMLGAEPTTARAEWAQSACEALWDDNVLTMLATGFNNFARMKAAGLIAVREGAETLGTGFIFHAGSYSAAHARYHGKTGKIITRDAAVPSSEHRKSGVPFPFLANNDPAAASYVRAAIRSNAVKALLHVILFGSQQLDGVPEQWHLLAPQFQGVARCHSANQLAARGYVEEECDGDDDFDEDQAMQVAHAAVKRCAPVVAVKAYRLAAAIAGVTLTPDERCAIGGPEAAALWDYRQPGHLHNDNLVQLTAVFQEQLAASTWSRVQQTARLLSFVVFGLNVGSKVLYEYVSTRKDFLTGSPKELLYHLRLRALRGRSAKCLAGELEGKLRYRLTNPLPIVSTSINKNTATVAGLLKDAKVSDDGLFWEGEVVSEGAIAAIFTHAEDLHRELLKGAKALDAELRSKVPSQPTTDQSDEDGQDGWMATIDEEDPAAEDDAAPTPVSKRQKTLRSKYPGLGGVIVHACIVRSLELSGVLGASIFEPWLIGHTGFVRHSPVQPSSPHIPPLTLLSPPRITGTRCSFGGRSPADCGADIDQGEGALPPAGRAENFGGGHCQTCICRRGTRCGSKRGYWSHDCCGT